jgi:amino acid transporter
MYRPEDIDLVTGVEEVNADAAMWNHLDNIQKQESGPFNLVWRVISVIWQ